MKKFKKPLRNGTRFHSYVNETIVSFFFKSIIMMISSWWIRRKMSKSDMLQWFCESETTSCSINPKITWIGHASFLIQIGGVNIITDPILKEPSRLFPRFVPLGIPLDKLPNIDFVLLSHNHPDHTDYKSLMILKKHNGTHFFVPEGDKIWFDNRGFARVREYTWWEQSLFNLKHDSSQQVKFTFLPANHWSKRSIFNKKNSSLWGGWMIECNGHKIYFAGDTAYESHFSEISQEFKDIDVALMPIGPCEPRSWVEESHVDAAQAGQAFLDLKAKHFIPMHWGTFPMGSERFDTPILRLQDWWKENAQLLQGTKLHVTKVGQCVEISTSVIEDIPQVVFPSDQIQPTDRVSK